MKGVVFKCLSCDQYITRMYDFSAGKVRDIEGNFLFSMANGHHIFIITSSHEKFREACGILVNSGWDLTNEYKIYEMNDVLLFTLRRFEGVVYFYEDWWENPLIQHPLISMYLNQWI